MQRHGFESHQARGKSGPHQGATSYLNAGTGTRVGAHRLNSMAEAKKFTNEHKKKHPLMY